MNKTLRKIEVTLDGEPIMLPAGRNTLNSIRGHLEMLTLSQQRILSVFAVDGQSLNLALPLIGGGGFSRVNAESVVLLELPLLLLTTAQQQVGRAHESVEVAVTLVLINDAPTARELWWDIARQLKEPVLTLSLMPENVRRLCGSVSFDQLHNWQLKQIATIVREVDSVCETMDTVKISDALENRVLPWLDKLGELIQLWHETTLAGSRLGIKHGTF
ncbi:MAG TPA: hypothetical protein VGI63_00865 [Verrucomicrobiae bacterium]|jgi:hypothetical protein